MKKGWIFAFLLMIVGIGALAKVFWFGGREIDFSGEKMITIVDDGHVHTDVHTGVRTFGELDLDLGEDDLFFPSLENRIYPGMVMTIKRAVPIEIEVDGGTTHKKVLSRTISDALEEVGVSLSHLDKVEPEKDGPVVAGATIEVTRIEVEEVTKTEKIDFETTEKEDDDLGWKKKKVKQEGEKGLKETVYKITYKNGKQQKKEKLSSRVVKKPVDEVVVIGTKVKVGKTKKGVASWYRFKNGMFCATRMWPRGTWLRVTSQENGKQIFVQVNDFGPMRGTGKMIDLDAVAFEKLAPLGKGVLGVKVEEIID